MDVFFINILVLLTSNWSAFGRKVIFICINSNMRLGIVAS